jgi:methionine synthase I (cobalamin-dependent)
MKRFRRAFRFVGAMFTLVGGMLLFSFVSLLFDQNSTIIVNGVTTSEFSPKLHAVLFNASFVIVGLFCLFGPNKLFNKLFVWRQSLTSTIFGRKH